MNGTSVESEKPTSGPGSPRDSLVQAQNRLEALDLMVEQAREEVRTLENFGLTSIAYGLMGNRKERLQQARESLAELEATIEACAGQIETLERECESSNAPAEHELKTTTSCRTHGCCDRPASGCGAGPCAASSDGPCELTRGIERALASAREAHRDLLDEIENVSTLGRAGMGDGVRLLKSIMNASRRKTAEDCAKRLGQSIGRLHRRMTEMISIMGDRTDQDLIEMLATLDHISTQVSDAWFYPPGGPNGESTGWMEDRVRTAMMLLERELVRVKSAPMSCAEAK